MVHLEQPASPLGPTPFEAFSQTNYGRVCDAIRNDIVAGRYPPGTRLKIQEIMAEYRISSNPIREALQQLKGEGLVVISPNKGATVREIDEQFLRNIYEIAEGMDGILAGLCAERATPAEIGRLREIHEEFGANAPAGPAGQRLRLNGIFHECIAAIARNPEALNIRRRHRNIVRTIRMQYGYEPQRFAEIQKEHGAIVDAIGSGDVAAAERAARFHVRQSYRDIVIRFQEYFRKR